MYLCKHIYIYIYTYICIYAILCYIIRQHDAQHDIAWHDRAYYSVIRPVHLLRVWVSEGLTQTNS